MGTHQLLLWMNHRLLGNKIRDEKLSFELAVSGLRTFEKHTFWASFDSYCLGREADILKTDRYHWEWLKVFWGKPVLKQQCKITNVYMLSSAVVSMYTLPLACSCCIKSSGAHQIQLVPWSCGHRGVWTAVCIHWSVSYSHVNPPTAMNVYCSLKSERLPSQLQGSTHSDQGPCVLPWTWAE